MRNVAAIVFGIFLAASPAHAQSPPPTTLQNVLDAAGTALGAHHVESVRAWHYHATLETAGLRGTADSWIARTAGAEATYAKLPPLSQDNGYDGSDSWTRDAKGVVVVDGSVAGRAAAVNGVYRDTFALWTHDRGGARVELGGRRTEGGAAYDVVRVTPVGSAVPFEYWFDSATHVPARVVETIGPVTTTTTFANYTRTSQGLRIAFSQKSLDSQGNATTLVLDRADVDPADTAARVRKPISHANDFSIAGGGETSVPFRLIDNHVYLDVMLDGKGPYRFIFDTGGQNVIDPAVARELGAGAVGGIQGGGVGASTEQVRFARVASLRVGKAELRDQVFAVLPVRAGFGISGSAAVDGLIGWEVLARFETTFDYGSDRVTLRTPGNAPLPGKPIHLVFGGTQPQVPCTIDSVATVCAIDTGSRSSIDLFSPFLAAHPDVIPANATAPGINGFGVGGGDVGRLGRLSSLEIGGYDLKGTIAGFSTATQGAFAAIGVGGNVGGGVWKRFTVTFDYPRQAMSLVPNAAFEAADTYDRSGVFAIQRDGRLVAADVRPATPAAEAGIKKGDAIVSINGGSGTALTLAALRAAFRSPAGSVVRLGILSAPATAPHDVTLTLRDYV